MQITGVIIGVILDARLLIFKTGRSLAKISIKTGKAIGIIIWSVDHQIIVFGPP